ncbi:ABC transporter substrate-binding protein [Paenibacillus herberti]|uniref:ABC transporter substrate-binding protein n=1 Tax=Paenibacillus herberti TaxID=1619309 RepID=A0A229NXJ1_9BACL|nr:iron-siderophore ABC transporter substrate-binding protein [Paenibacillus herberti]OXM14652.1 ABC transporter substrate-binding protein [Paenibacillus herberti]
MIGHSMHTRRNKGTVGMLLLLVIILVSGCSSGNNGKANSSNGSNTGNTTNEASTETSSDTRTVKDAYGDVQVPTNPTKIVVLDIGALDNLLEMGIVPIGAPSILAAGDPYPKYLKNTDGIKNIGSVNEPNMEAIDALQPDLIIGNKDTHDAIYKQLGEIAPTVFVETLGTTWKENLKLHSEAVNKQAEGDKLLAAYQQKTEELKSKIAGKTGTAVSLFRPRADKIQIYMKATFAGAIMNDAGVVRPAAQNNDEFSKDVTEEQIAELDGDVILWFDREADAFAKLEKSSLWSSLKGVQNKNVHSVDWEYWLSGLGIQAATKIVDDLNKFLVK